MLMAMYKQIHPICSLWFTYRYTNAGFNGCCWCVFIFVSITVVTFLPGYQRKLLKRAFNRKQGTSDISQATRAWWIIQNKLTTCCHVAMSAESCLTCNASLMCIYISVALMYIYMLDSWSVCFLGCFVLWSLGGFCCNARWNQITVKCCIKKYDITDGISTFTFCPLFRPILECCIYSTGFYIHSAAYCIDNTCCARN